jgi:parvulin-like peptidyl-prolyl isomerase
MKRWKFVSLCFGLLVAVALPLAAAPEKDGVADKAGKNKVGDAKKAANAVPALDYIAIVNGQKIPIGQYMSALSRGVRERFYHGKVEEGEAKKFRKEVADELIERALLVQEAKRRKLKPNAEEVEKNLATFDAKYKDNPEWQKAREKVLPQLREKLSDDSLAKVIKAEVMTVKAPTDKELRAYYQEHKDLFTTPSRTRVSLILLRVDPSSTSEVWKQASDEAGSIVERINKGADFAELARIHSSDKSAANGGDMGFIHTGMLGENAQKVLDIMEPGEVSAPVVLLEGVAIFRLEERTKPELNDFDSVKERAGKLFKREKGETEWKALLEKLHKSATVKVNDAPWR